MLLGIDPLIIQKHPDDKDGIFTHSGIPAGVSNPSPESSIVKVSKLPVLQSYFQIASAFELQVTMMHCLNPSHLKEEI